MFRTVTLTNVLGPVRSFRLSHWTYHGEGGRWKVADLVLLRLCASLQATALLGSGFW